MFTFESYLNNQEYIKLVKIFKLILIFKMEEKTHPGYPQDGFSRQLEWLKNL